ncbi:hypothetical protein KIPB_009124, partial [Kipferlia bialata]
TPYNNRWELSPYFDEFSDPTPHSNACDMMSHLPFRMQTYPIPSLPDECGTDVVGIALLSPTEILCADGFDCNNMYILTLPARYP